MLSSDLQSFYPIHLLHRLRYHLYTTLTKHLRELLEKADILFHKVSTNASLLDKLRKDLVDAKIKYGQFQTELATAENEGIKLRKLKESESMNFGEIIEDLISIVFERSVYEDGTERKEIESLQTFAALVARISDAVDKGQNFKIDFTFMNVDDCEGGRLQASAGNEKPKPLKGDKFEKSNFWLLEWFGLKLFFPKMKEPITIDALKKNPAVVECVEADVNYLEKIMMPLCKSNISKARRELRDFTKAKFFPMSIRPKLWKRTIHNIAGMTKKLYKLYCESIEKHKVSLPGEDHSLFGSQQIIETSLAACIKDLNLGTDKQDVNQSIIRMLLVFEYLHPDVGYVIGMERLAFFLRSMVGIEEETAFIIMYNIYFSSEFLWATLSGDSTLLNHYMNVMKNLVESFSEFKEMYAVNQQHFERFFIESSQTFFVGILTPEIIEKLIDYFCVWDETVVFSIMLKIIKTFNNHDLSSLSYSKARNHLIKCAKEISDVEYIQAIMMTATNYKELKDVFATSKIK